MSPFLTSIIFVVFGQLLNAAVVLIDKFIITKTAVSKPSTYTFYVGMISGIVLIMIPFNIVHLPTLSVVMLSILAGFTFIGSIYFLFTALIDANATDAVAWLATVSTITTFILGFFILNEELPKSFPVALILLLVGMALVGHFRFHTKSFLLIVISGILFGLSAILMKVLFSQTDFTDGFFWSRMGNLFAAIMLIALPSVRRSIFENSRNISRGTTFLIIANRALGGLALVLILYAIRIGSVSIVNSLASLQFVFVFVLVLLLTKKMPDVYQHEFRHGHVLHKTLAAFFIIAGFFVLFV